MWDEDVKASEIESCLNEEVKNELCDNVAKELHTFAEARDEYASVDLLDTDAGFGFEGDEECSASEVEAGLNEELKDEFWDENAKQ